MDETAQVFIQLMQSVMVEVTKDNLHRERLKAAATITAAILQNPNFKILSREDVVAAATYGAIALEVLDKEFKVGEGVPS